MPALRQPLRGVAAALFVMVVALVFISLFDWTDFAGWVSYYLMCAIPVSLVIGVTWHGSQPAFIAGRRQPLKGLLFLALALLVGLLVAWVFVWTLGAGITPPTPPLVQAIIASVVVCFWLTFVWQGWPFTLIRNQLLAGAALLVGCYVIAAAVFTVFFDFAFLQGNPLYHAEQDPGGLYSGWDATAYLVTGVAVMFLMLHFDLWPLNRWARVMKQPLLGLVWMVTVLVLAALVYWIGTGLLGLDAPVYLVWVPIPFIFGSIVLLVTLGGSVFERRTQPLKGVASAVTAAVVGVVLALAYRSLAGTVTGDLEAGAPAYDLEVWLASALLAVTFPFLAFHSDFFALWPLAGTRDAEPEPETDRPEPEDATA